MTTLRVATAAFLVALLFVVASSSAANEQEKPIRAERTATKRRQGSNEYLKTLGKKSLASHMIGYWEILEDHYTLSKDGVVSRPHVSVPHSRFAGPITEVGETQWTNDHKSFPEAGQDDQAGTPAPTLATLEMGHQFAGVTGQLRLAMNLSTTLYDGILLGFYGGFGFPLDPEFPVVDARVEFTGDLSGYFVLGTDLDMHRSFMTSISDPEDFEDQGHAAGSAVEAAAGVTDLPSGIKLHPSEVANEIPFQFRKIGDSLWSASGRCEGLSLGGRGWYHWVFHGVNEFIITIYHEEDQSTGERNVTNLYGSRHIRVKEKGPMRGATMAVMLILLIVAIKVSMARFFTKGSKKLKNYGRFTQLLQQQRIVEKMKEDDREAAQRKAARNSLANATKKEQ